MINPTDEIFVDLQASCTKEVAVAKMLGWMQGFIRPRYIQVTESGISADQLPSLRSLEGSLQEHLAERHEAARQDLFKAAEGDAPAEALLKYSEAVLDCEDLIKRAAIYLIDIEDEIAKGESSALRIDRNTTESEGVIYLTIKSVHLWAQGEYGISIIEALPTQTEEKNPPVQSLEQKEESSEKGYLGKSKAENLYTTFAILIEDFATRAPIYRHKSDNSPNVSTIAKRLAKLAYEANLKKNLRGQGVESIKDLIEEAIKIKMSRLSIEVLAASKRPLR